MRLVSVYAPLRALLVTTALGLAFFLMALLTFHYVAATASSVAENRRLKEQMQSVVGRLADLESDMARIAAARRAIDDASRTGLRDVVEKTGLSADHATGIALALTPASDPQNVPSGGDTRTFADVVERFTVARASADHLATSLGATAQALDVRSQILRSLPSILPAKGSLSSGFGMRESPFHPGFVGMHNGLDVACAEGTAVVATADGIVSFSGENGSFGKLVAIDHGLGIATKYGHNSRLLVKRGDRVVRGQSIAMAGNTGRSTGAHVHYEVLVYDKPVDPRRFLFEARRDETLPPELSAAEAHIALGGEAPFQVGDTASDSDTPALPKGAWDRPVLATRDGVLLGAAPLAVRGATTGDTATAILALILFAVATAVLRIPVLTRRDDRDVDSTAKLIRAFQKRREASAPSMARLTRWGRLKALLRL